MSAQDSIREIEPQIKQAYADGYYAADDLDNEFDPDDRCLNFLACEFVTPEDAMALVKWVGQYNAFDPVNVRDAISVIEGADPDARIAIGREGSPVIYVDVDPSTSTKVWDVFDRMGSGPDELDYVYPEDVGPSDVLDKGTVHAYSCAHDEPPVPEGGEAKPRSGHDVIRAWWD